MVTIQPDVFVFQNRPVMSSAWRVDEMAGAYRGWFLASHREAIGFAATIAAQHGACSLLIDREA